MYRPNEIEEQRILELTHWIEKAKEELRKLEEKIRKEEEGE